VGKGPGDEEDKTSPAYIQPRPPSLPSWQPPPDLFGGFTFPPPMTPPGPLTIPVAPLPPTGQGPLPPPPSAAMAPQQPPPSAPMAPQQPPRSAPMAPPQPPRSAPVAAPTPSTPAAPVPPVRLPDIVSPDPSTRPRRPMTPPNLFHSFGPDPGPWESPLDTPSRSGSLASSRSGSIALSSAPHSRTLPPPAAPADRRRSSEIVSRRASDIVTPPPASTIVTCPPFAALVGLLPPAQRLGSEEPPSFPTGEPPFENPPTGFSANVQRVVNMAYDWLNKDAEPETRAEIQNLLRQKNWAELESRLTGRLVFGTAGLRAKCGRFQLK